MTRPLKRLRLAVAAAWLAVFATIAYLTASAPAAQATVTGCSVDYQVLAHWPDGFQAQVTITQHGPALGSWRLEFDLPAAGQRLNTGWSAAWEQQGGHVTASSLSWNSELATDRPVGTGFLGSFTGTANPAPTAFSLNGVPCVGPVTGPTTTGPVPTLVHTTAPAGITEY